MDDVQHEYKRAVWADHWEALNPQGGWDLITFWEIFRHHVRRAIEAGEEPAITERTRQRHEREGVHPEHIVWPEDWNHPSVQPSAGRRP